MPLDPALLPRPFMRVFGLIPIKPVMLGAANGGKARYCVTSIFKSNFGWELFLFLPKLLVSVRYAFLKQGG
ncbi:hypothetical protein CEK71_14845 [Methylovulum psychrotolerans]|uniref:Uncharacterized protein n=1 Tax=Methylovulum psychrotolerans TaxID=1704499 RepID=A0A1Z4C147_9GAMM|nr:hypothetical protein CEK71_14845 [Methylovulum psychrotolerans]